MTHQRRTSGVYRIRRSWSTSLSETGRSRTAAPRSSVTSGSVCQAGAVIVGVGIDVVDVGRFAETIERTPAMLERVFTPEERRRPLASQAARFAAKEALAKALGAPQDLQWHDAEVVTTEDGRPWFEVRGSVAKRCEHLGVETVHLSLSHDAGIASAVVVLEGTL
jgi:holo-[acyl-carrier protein] synthase